MIYDEVYEVLRGDGSRGLVSISTAPILDKDKKIIGGIVINQDVTRIKKNEIALREALQIRDDFLSIASHELKTPITSLKLNTQVLLKSLAKNGVEGNGERIVTFVKQTDKQVNRINRLIDDMLDIARIRTGRLHVERHDVELCER